MNFISFDAVHNRAFGSNRFGYPKQFLSRAWLVYLIAGITCARILRIIVVLQYLQPIVGSGTPLEWHIQ